ncbi:MAG TPA: phosphoenolpyruvate-utilizing N-terminal domain-containing protein, partial [Candidatus Limnocylindrales bacterium]|nr:phosphoenolpyruvate-utilizing N-terminal domain-containing protein [Candidatus Limnocylindrales bacterium]
MDRIRGTAASPGVARGPWVVIEARPLPTGRTIEPTEVEAEVARIRAASDAAATDLEAIAADVRATGHADEAEIFEAQASIARDPALEAAAEGRIREWRDD